MLIIGLTGGIGSGKSTVARLFAQHGVPVIDMDVIAREVVAPGQAALEDIVRLFGRDYLLDNGSLNRAMLRETIFNHPDKRKQLENILHPRIRETVKSRLAQLHAPYVIIVIPLLLETRQTDLIDRILVIDTTVEQQIKRTKNRDHISEEQVTKILTSQVDRQTRLDAADDILHNSDGINELSQQVAALHKHYLTLAGA